MEKTLVKAFFDACRYARHITDMVQKLPDGIHAHHVYTIGAVHSLSSKGGATIPEVAAFLGVSHKTAGEYLRDLYHKGLVKKSETVPPNTGQKLPASSGADVAVVAQESNAKNSTGRSHIRVLLTEQGKEYHAQYVEKYYDHILNLFGSINNNDMNTAIRTIKQAHYLMARDAHETH